MAVTVSIGELRRTGLDAYATWLRDDPEAAQQPWLPAPDRALPLGILAWIASSTEAFLSGRSAGRFEIWWKQHEGSLRELVPEAQGWSTEGPPWGYWVPPSGASAFNGGRADWSMLERAAAAYARAIGRSRVESTTAFYVLLRDWSFDLEPLLAEVKLGLDDALLWSRGFEATSDPQSLARLSQRETRISQELDLPTSSWTMFAAYAGSAEPVVITLFDDAGVSEGNVKDAIRRLVGSQTVHRLPSQTITSDVWTTRDQLAARAELRRQRRARGPATQLRAISRLGHDARTRQAVDRLAK